MKPILFLITCTMLFACSSNSLKKQEIKSEHFKSIYYIDKDSLKQGMFVELTMDDDTVSTAIYKDGKLDGQRNIYHKEGYLQITENYRMDVRHGPELTFHPNGSVHTKGNFTDGFLDSLFYVYYDSGELWEKVSMRDNLENGPFEEYYKSGQLHWEGNFINGDTEVGILNEYDEKGELIKKMDCGLYRGDYICQTIWTREKGTIKPKLTYDQ